MSAILSKRHIIIAALVVALGLAVYLNWQFSKAGEDFVLTNTSNSSAALGEAALVNGSSAGTTTGSRYFDQARQNRTQTREEALDVLQDVLVDIQSDDAVKANTIAASVQIAQNIETEGQIENLILAKGFADCMVYIDGQSVEVVVQSDGLLASEVAQIKDIVTTKTNISPDNITILPVSSEQVN